MFTYKEWFQRNFCLCLMVMIMTGLAASPVGAYGPDICEEAVWVAPGALWSGYGGGRREILAFDVTSKGFFGLQATTPATSGVEPQLVALGRDCTGDMRGVTVLRRYLSGYVLRVEEPGIYYFFVGSQNPGEPLGEYEIRSRFVGRRELGPIQTKDITEGEDDPILLLPPSYCEGGDDHADTFECATPLILGDPESGEIEQGDVDTFTFLLDDQMTTAVRAVTSRSREPFPRDATS
jgi:hypothetical protein